MIPVQRSPSGLLGLFDSKSTGENPNALQRIIAPTVEVTPWYLARQLQSEGNLVATTASAVDAVVERAIPDGQAWYMLSGACNFGPAVPGEGVRLSFRIRTPDGGYERVFTSPWTVVEGSANGNLSFGFLFRQPVILLPGCAIQCIVDDIDVAVARPIGVSCAFYQLDV